MERVAIAVPAEELSPIWFDTISSQNEASVAVKSQISTTSSGRASIRTIPCSILNQTDSSMSQGSAINGHFSQSATHDGIMLLAIQQMNMAAPAKEAAVKREKKILKASKAEASNGDDYLNVLTDQLCDMSPIKAYPSSQQHGMFLGYPFTTSEAPGSVSSADSSSGMLLHVAMTEFEKPLADASTGLKKKRRGKMLDDSEINPLLQPVKSKVANVAKPLSAAAAKKQAKASAGQHVDEDEDADCVLMMDHSAASKSTKGKKGIAAPVLTKQQQRLAAQEKIQADMFPHSTPHNHATRRPPHGRRSNGAPLDVGSQGLTVYRSGLTPALDDVNLSDQSIILSPDDMNLISPAGIRFTPNSNYKFTDGKTPNSSNSYGLSAFTDGLFSPNMNDLCMPPGFSAGLDTISMDIFKSPGGMTPFFQPMPGSTRSLLDHDFMGGLEGIASIDQLMGTDSNGSNHSRESQRSDNIMGSPRTQFSLDLLAQGCSIASAEKPVKRMGRRQRHLASLEEGEDHLQNRLLTSETVNDSGYHSGGDEERSRFGGQRIPLHSRENSFASFADLIISREASPEEAESQRLSARQQVETLSPIAPLAADMDLNESMISTRGSELGDELDMNNCSLLSTGMLSAANTSMNTSFKRKDRDFSPGASDEQSDDEDEDMRNSSSSTMVESYRYLDPTTPERSRVHSISGITDRDSSMFHDSVTSSTEQLSSTSFGSISHHKKGGRELRSTVIAFGRQQHHLVNLEENGHLQSWLLTGGAGEQICMLRGANTSMNPSFKRKAGKDFTVSGIIIQVVDEGTVRTAPAPGVPFVKDFKENHTDTTVLFTVTVPPEKLIEFQNEKGGLQHAHIRFEGPTSMEKN
eukprot:gene27058-33725_t